MYLCPHHKKCDIFVTSSLALAVSSSSDFVTPKRLTQVGQEIIQVLYPPALLLVDALPFLSLASSFLFVCFFFPWGYLCCCGVAAGPLGAGGFCWAHSSWLPALPAHFRAALPTYRRNP